MCKVIQCIADRNGRVGWLTGQDAGVESADSFPEFVNGVDTVIMGWRTCHQIVTELSPGRRIIMD